MTTANSPASKEVVTAALLVIGSKILSGRTKDQNIGYVAECLTAVGIDLNEVRVVRSSARAGLETARHLQGRIDVALPEEEVGDEGLPTDEAPPDPQEIALLR